MQVLRATLVFSTMDCIGAVSSLLVQISGFYSAKQIPNPQTVILQTALYPCTTKASVTALSNRGYVLFVVNYLVFQLLFQISLYGRKPKLERDVSEASLLTAKRASRVLGIR